MWSGSSGDRSAWLKHWAARLALCLALTCSLGAAGVRAQDSGAAAIPLESRAEGAPITRVEVVLTRGSGKEARDGGAVQRLRRLLAPLEGRNYRRSLVEREIAVARAPLGPIGVDFRLIAGAIPGTVGVRVEVDMAAQDAGAPAGTPPAPVGALLGDWTRFPVLYRSDRAVVNAMVSGGFGLYSDPNPWFGRTQAFIGNSPLAGRLPGRAPTWTEGFVEYGLSAATQIGDSPFYAYGAITFLTSWSLGQDIYRADPRSLTSLEKAYAGLLYVDPATGASLNVSAGRQTVTLNDGFLIHFVRGSANIGSRAGLYLGPRTANDFSVVVDGRYGPWSFKAFYIDPSELALVDSRSTFAGFNLRYQITPTLSVDGTIITVPRTTSTFALPDGTRAPRDGLRTLAGHVRWNQAFGVDGLWMAGEFAHQTSDRIAMSAYAAYGLVGYRATWLPWSPSLSYRYAFASGDDPRTARYERFDPLLSTGLGNWLQGVTFGKLISNSNLAVHRVQFNVEPTPALNVTFDWHLLRAPQLNNLGSNPLISQLTSHDIGQEFTLTARWAINRNLFLQSLVSVAVPGRAFRDIGATRSWTTLQASLYWSL